MVRHPTARRVKRGHASEPDDVFVARLLELTAWAREHARILTIVGVVLVLGISAGLYYRNVQATIRAQSETRLETVRQTVASGNTALAIRDLEQFVTTYKGTRAAEEARVLLGQVHLDAGQPQEALDAVNPLASSIGKGLGTSAAFVKAAAFEADGQAQSAESLYLQIAERARYDYERFQALDAAARVRMQGGNVTGAAELYERLLEILPDNDPERAVVELRLAEARASASGS